jgi:hypothetical protein
MVKRTDKAELLGLAFDAVTMDGAVARCLGCAARRAPRAWSSRLTPITCA